ncbi:MAG: LptF/LptG family permease [Planctomycetes bacterium]|nr:LptF/LptG family permease [Planctomycetota bacterium]MBI3834679.1 LptF/LptG family permease [Planctomycetota bacterium]
MGFPWTLQKYILRETGKAFLLTALALTAVLGLGGGVLQMIQVGEVTPGQLGRLLAFVLPVSAALTLPIAALFSATVTYGRLSADNEFVACRASGVNLYVLLLPTIAISLLSAMITFGFTNFLIPGMVRNLNEFVSSDIGMFVRQRLKNPRGIQLTEKYRVHADDADILPDQSNRVLLHHVAFVESDGQEWTRYGTSRLIDLEFTRGASQLSVSGTMHDVSIYDGRRFADVAEERLPTRELPTLLRRQVKFLNLSELIEFLRKPDAWPNVASAFTRLRFAVSRRIAYQSLMDEFNAKKLISLANSSGTLALRSNVAALISDDGGVEMTEAGIIEGRGDHVRKLNAGRVLIEVVRGDMPSETGFRVEGYEVRSSDRNTPAISKEAFGIFAVPQSVIDEVAAKSNDDLIRCVGKAPAGAQQTSFHARDAVAERRAEVMDERSELERRIIATMHERSAFSVSIFVLVILGAALGIIFRGAHVLTAFGISFIPSLVVILCIVMGRQMAINARTHDTGLMLMWAGIALVAVIDVVTLTKVLRR